MQPFRPSACPRLDCPSRRGEPFAYRRRGRFKRRCDGRVVRRFLCLACRRGFSQQTFRLDYRLKRPELLPSFFLDRVSNCTHRQSARNHGCSRTTEERHFRRLGEHCRAFHEKQLESLARSHATTFLLDELETYEQHRTQKPVTVPILIERESGFVVDAQVGALPPLTKIEGSEPRRSESREVVQAVLQRLRALPEDEGSELRVVTDEKPSYARVLKELFDEDGARKLVHETASPGRARDQTHSLSPITHTLARVREDVSRVERDTWAAAKKRRWLASHLAIWIAYRNYVRGKTNKEHRVTPAMAMGFDERPRSVRELLAWTEPKSRNSART